MRITRYLVIAGVAYAVPASAQQQTPQPSLTIEQRVGMVVGPIITQAAVLSAQVEQMKDLIAQRDKTIADLQAQVEALKPKDAPK